MFAPKDAPSASLVGQVLQTAAVPAVVYGTEAFEALTARPFTNIITTAPAIKHFIQVPLTTEKLIILSIKDF